MGRYDVSAASGRWSRRDAPARAVPVLPLQRDGHGCDLYSPGHLMHYRHQAQAVRGAGRTVLSAVLDGPVLTLLLDGAELRWRHHDPARLRRLLESVPTQRTAYLGHHALRLGPYWFNCAETADPWQDCRTSAG